MKISKIFATAACLREASRHYDSGLVRTLRVAGHLYSRNLYSLEDILFWGLTDPAIPLSNLDRYVSREARVRWADHFNAKAHLPLADDKRLFSRRCIEAKVPAAVDVAVLPSLSGMQSQQTWAATLAAFPDGRFIAKPSMGTKGKGISAIDKTGGEFALDGQTCSLVELCQALELRAAGDALVVQHRLASHADLQKLSGSSSLQTVRAVTLLDRDNGFHVMFALLKIIVGDNVADNFADGRSGNVIAPIDLQTGKLTDCRTKVVGEIGLRHITHHPVTKEKIPGFTVPLWHELKSQLRTAAMAFAELPLLGWDVAITQEGIRVIEANNDWEIFSIAPFQFPPQCKTWRDLMALGPGGVSLSSEPQRQAADTPGGT